MTSSLGLQVHVFCQRDFHVSLQQTPASCICYSDINQLDAHFTSLFHISTDVQNPLPPVVFFIRFLNIVVIQLHIIIFQTICLSTAWKLMFGYRQFCYVSSFFCEYRKMQTSLRYVGQVPSLSLFHLGRSLISMCNKLFQQQMHPQDCQEFQFLDLKVTLILR